MRKALLALCLLAPLQLLGQTCTTSGTQLNAATCSEADVNACFSAANSSTTQINIPAGTCGWTSQLTVNTPSTGNLTVQGATTTTCTGTPGLAGYACSAADGTIIQDNVAGNFTVWQINVTAGATFRITGITMAPGTGLNKFGAPGTLAIYSSSTVNPATVRIDHNHFNLLGGPTGWDGSLNKCIYGVGDHNRFDTASPTATSGTYQTFMNANTCNDSLGFGDGSWAVPTAPGSANSFFWENNDYEGGLVGDCIGGGTFVDRYNTVNSDTKSSSLIHNHGTAQNGGRTRSCRAFEAYHNYLNPATGGSALIGDAGGTGLVWGNTLSRLSGVFLAVGDERNDGGHSQSPTPGAWGYCGIGTLNPSGPTSNWDENVDTTGRACLDGIGRGQGVQALNGLNFPSALNSTTGTIAWPQEYLEPVYAFMNTLAGTTPYSIASPATVINRDMYVDNASCVGGGACASGTGFGTSLPTTCTAGPGGAYGASPTGSYGTGFFLTTTQTFYACTATNNWTPIYTPYTYPHPLSGSVVAAPTFSPAPGSYGSAQTVTLADATGGATICYTTNGSTPTTNGAGSCGVGTSLYSIPFLISSTSTVKAVGTKSGSSDSSIASGLYTINGAAAAPTFSPVAGTYGPTQNVTISSGTTGATICWTNDGSTPTADGAGTCTHGTTYSGTVSVASSLTLKAIASKSGWNDSSVASAAYVINGAASTPTFSPVAGSYGPTQNVTISTSTAGATICYTTSGTTPTSSSPGVCAAGSTQYVAPVSVATSLTLKAIATKAGFSDSSVGSAAYTINGAVASVTFSPVGGSYGPAQSVTLTTATGSAVICYTTDGTTPTATTPGTCSHGTTYSGAITVSTSQLINALGTKASFSNSSVTSAAYVINGTLPTPTFAPAAGTYASAQTVTISAFSGSAVVMVNTMQETANANDTIGSSVHRNTYNNCATGYSGGVLQPAGQPVGTLYCTAADKTAALLAGGPNNGVVTSTISGTGTTPLDNGNGAGGTDSAVSVTATYAGSTGSDCGAHGDVVSGYISGLTFTDPGASAQLIMGITTGSPGNSSILTVSKYNSNGDTGRYVAQRDCVTPSSLAKSGEHYESDYNYNDTHGSYFGYGKDYDAPNLKFRAAPQGAPWVNEELCPVAGGSCLTTFTIPPGDSLVWESYEYWNPGCSFSSGTACAFYDVAGLQLYSGGSPVGSMVYYNVRNASTHGLISFIPLNKTAWTHPQYAIQHQWDINQSSQTLTATIPYSTAVAYFTTSGTATICYTVDGSTPTTNGAGTCTHGTTYSGPVTVASSLTIKAIATEAGFTDSAEGDAAYVIGVADPTFSPAPGSYGSTQSVTLSDSTAGSTICYTIDGSTPTATAGSCTHGTTYSTAISVSTTTTIKAIGSKSGLANSNVVTVTYTINGTVSTPTFSPVAGTYAGTQSVTISSSTAGATLCYTIDGSTPLTDGAGTCTHGTTYTIPVSVPASLTIKAVGTKASFTDSSVASAAYVITLPPPAGSVILAGLIHKIQGTVSIQ